MTGLAVDAGLLQAWLAGRSIARGLPAPVPDRGGFRIDTHGEGEVCRWVFAGMCPGLFELAATIDSPGYLLKICAPADDLRAVLPRHWVVEPSAYFMKATGAWESRALPAGYVVDVDVIGATSQVRILTTAGDVAASGFAAETPDAFVYDRIVTAPEHRRRGLGRALMTALRGTRRQEGLPELLAATEEGRALYTSLGWETLSAYSTGFIGSD